MDGEHVDREVARLAKRQGGKVSRAQARGLGLSDDEIDGRLKRGVFHHDHRGVLAVGHVRVDALSRWWGALLACPGSVLSHWTAAAAWDLLPLRGTYVHITVSTSGGRAKRDRVKIHRQELRGEHRAAAQGLPVTSVMRTLADLAVVADARTLRKAVEAAERRRLLDMAHFEPRRAGARRLRDALALPVELTFSELERVFLELCAEHDLAAPLVNSAVDEFMVDFRWPDVNLIVETDGAKDHFTRDGFEGDRAKDVELVARGHRVVRFTHRQVLDRARTARKLRALGAPRRSSPARSRPAARG